MRLSSAFLLVERMPNSHGYAIFQEHFAFIRLLSDRITNVGRFSYLRQEAVSFLLSSSFLVEVYWQFLVIIWDARRNFIPTIVMTYDGLSILHSNGRTTHEIRDQHHSLISNAFFVIKSSKKIV